jgi:transcriptional regulator GlxA family with amidase domain
MPMVMSAIAFRLLLDSRILARQAVAEMPNTPRILPTPAASAAAVPDAPRRIEILAFPRVQLLDVAGPLQVFATANEQAGAAGLAVPYQAVVVAAQPAVLSSAGLGLAARPLPAPRGRLDTVLVAGGIGVHDACRDAHLLRWVVQRSTRARRTASVCSGAFLLAAAGLLDGRRATTHWNRCAELAQQHPAIRVEPDPIFVRDGAVWTSAGVTAGIDLALAFVEADLGRAMALAVARQLVVFVKRPGGQAQFSAGLALSADADFDALHAWIQRNLRHDLSVPVLAGRAGMSERSFARHYRTATGTTPSRAVERLRVEAARDALGSTRRSIKEIARRCGFGSEETMRRSFLRLLAVAPRDYRARFSARA